MAFLFLLSFIIFKNKKLIPKIRDEYNCDSTQIIEASCKNFYHSIPLTLGYGTTYLTSVVNSEVVFNNTCSGNLSAGEFPSLKVVAYLLVLFIAFNLYQLYSSVPNL